MKNEVTKPLADVIDDMLCQSCLNHQNSILFIQQLLDGLNIIQIFNFQKSKMMQRREAYGRKAATQAMLVIAESIKASRGRRGKETPVLSRDVSEQTPTQSATTKGKDTCKVQKVLIEDAENVVPFLLSPEEEQSLTQVSNSNKENIMPQKQRRQSCSQQKVAIQGEEKVPGRVPLQDKLELSTPIVLSEKSNQAAGGKHSQPTNSLKLLRKRSFAEPLALLPSRAARSRRGAKEEQENSKEPKLEARKILNDPEKVVVPYFQKSHSMTQTISLLNHPIIPDISIFSQTTSGGLPPKQECEIFLPPGSSIMPSFNENKKKQGATKGDHERELKDIKHSDLEVNRQTVASSTINIKNHMTNDSLLKPTTNQQSHEAAPDASAQKLLEDLEYALSGTRGLQPHATPMAAQPQVQASGKSGVASATSSSDEDEDEEEMMADDGDDGNIMTQSVTGRGNDGGPGGQGSGSPYQGRWTQEEHDKFIEGLQLFGKDWRRIEEYIGSRTCAQIRSHAQKYFNRLQRDIAKGIKRADESQLSFALGKKKKKQLLAQQAAAAAAQQASAIKPPAEEEKSTIQGSLPYKRKEDSQQKVFNTSTTPPSKQDISCPLTSTPVILEKQEPLPVLSQPNFQIQRIQDTLLKLAEDDLGMQMKQLIAQRENISLEVLLQRLTRSMAGEQLVIITNKFHSLAMQALQQGKFDTCNRLIDERNLTQFVCILLSRQITIFPPGTEQQYQASQLVNGQAFTTYQAPFKEIVQKVELSPRQRATAAGRQ